MGRFSRKLLSAAVALSVVISGIGIVPAYAEGEIISNEYVEVAPDRYVPVSEITLPTGGALDTVLYDVPTEEVERINGALEEDGAVYIPGANDLSPASSYTYSSSYFYNNVLADSNEKAFYNALTAACNAVVQSNADYTDAQHTVHYNNTNTTANIIGAVGYSGFSEDRASFIFTLFRFSNPQFYFLSNGSGSGWSSDGTNTYYYLYPQFINTYGYDFALYNTRNTAQTALDTLTETWMTEFDAISSDLDRELAVSNKIINYLTYDDPALSNNDLLSFDQSLISGVLRQTTVCAGYTMMTAYFLNAAGIESFYVNSDGHAWNLVKLYGNWYELDNTWADQDSGANPYTWERWRNKSHAYFLSYEDEDNSHAYKSFWNGVALPTTQYDEVQVPEEPYFDVHSLLLSGQIGVCFYVHVPSDDGIDYSNSYMKFKVRNKEVTSQGILQSDGRYKFICYVNSLETAETITAEYHYGNNKTLYDTYSVKTYIDKFLSLGRDEISNSLMRSIADFGHYAGDFLDEVHSLNGAYTLIDNKTEIDDSVVATVTQEIDGYNFIRDTGDSGIERVIISLSLDSDTSINLYLVPKTGYTGNITVSGGYTPVLQNDGSYLVKISNIASHRLADNYSVTVTAGSSFVVTVSALSYAKAAINSPAFSDKGKKAMAAMYRYYKASMDYKDANNIS